MFQFTRFPLPALCVQTGVTPHYGCRVYPFGHPRFNAQSAASRGLSQPLTTFIGSQCQGIHRWLFVAWVIFLTSITRCSCSLCNSQEAKGDDCDNGEPPSLARHQTSRTTPQNSLEGRSSRDRDVAASSKRKRRTPPTEDPETRESNAQSGGIRFDGGRVASASTGSCSTIPGLAAGDRRITAP